MGGQGFGEGETIHHDIAQVDFAQTFDDGPIGQRVDAILVVGAVGLDVRRQCDFEIFQTVDGKVRRHIILQFQFEVERDVAQTNAAHLLHFVAPREVEVEVFAVFKSGVVGVGVGRHVVARCSQKRLLCIGELGEQMFPDVVAKVVTHVQLVDLYFRRGLLYGEVQVGLPGFHEVVKPVGIGFDISFGFEEVYEFNLFSVAEFHLQSINIEFHFHIDIAIVDGRVNAATQHEGGRKYIESAPQERT